MGKCVVHPIGGGAGGSVVLEGQSYQTVPDLAFYSHYRAVVCDPGGKYTLASDQQIDPGYNAVYTFLTPDRSKLVQLKYKDRDYKLFVYNIKTNQGYGVSLTNNGWYSGSGTIEYLDNECALLLNNNRIFDVRFDESSAKMEVVISSSAVNAGNITKDSRIIANPFNRFLDRDPVAVILYAVPPAVYCYRYDKKAHTVSSVTCSFPSPISTNSWSLQSYRWLDKDTVLLHVEMTTSSQTQTQSTILVLYHISSNTAKTAYANPSYIVTSAYSNYVSILNLPNGNILVVGRFQNKPSAKEFRLDGETLIPIREVTDIWINNFAVDIYEDKIYSSSGMLYWTIDDLNTQHAIESVAAAGGALRAVEDSGYLTIGTSQTVLAFHTADPNIEVVSNRADNSGAPIILVPNEKRVITVLKI